MQHNEITCNIIEMQNGYIVRFISSTETKGKKEFQTIEIKPIVPSETTTSLQNIQKQNLKILQ